MGMKVNGTSGLTFPDTTTLASAGQASVRAWVYFTASGGTPAIQSAYNITSITDNGTGDYTFNFTNSLPDANFAFVGLGTSGGANYQIAGGGQGSGTVRDASSLRTPFGYPNQSNVAALINQDPATASIAIFR